MMENKISNYKEIKITQQMIDDYAEASKDFNPIHIDEEFAEKSIFKSRIAHGMLTLSLIMEYLYDVYSEKMLQNTLFDARLKNPVYSEEKIKIYLEEKTKEKINIICKKDNGDEAVSASLLFK
ncbi:MAG: MaoC family dehydratase [Chloroflexota bacterium]|nr:MaoC family dehydratase [Chloroflexota bacterium]